MEIIQRFKEFKQKHQGILTLIELGLLFAVIYIYNVDGKLSKERDLKICLEYVELSVEGLIDTCFIDYENKASFTFRLRGEEIYRCFPISRPTQQIEVGDYLKKIEGETKYIIFKHNYRDSVFFINFECKGLKSGR